MMFSAHSLWSQSQWKWRTDAHLFRLTILQVLGLKMDIKPPAGSTELSRIYCRLPSTIAVEVDWAESGHFQKWAFSVFKTIWGIILYATSCSLVYWIINPYTQSTSLNSNFILNIHTSRAQWTWFWYKLILTIMSYLLLYLWCLVHWLAHRRQAKKNVCWNAEWLFDSKCWNWLQCWQTLIIKWRHRLCAGSIQDTISIRFNIFFFHII